MENILVFVFSLAIIISIIALVSNASMVSFYQTAQAEKKMLEFFHGDVLTFFRTDGTLTPADHILYITSANGEVNITNGGLSDAYSMRLLCWNRSDPINTITPIHGEVNGVLQPASIEVLSPYSPLNIVEYNLIIHGFTLQDINNNNVACVVVGMRFIRGFVVHG